MMCRLKLVKKSLFIRPSQLLRHLTRSLAETETNPVRAFERLAFSTSQSHAGTSKWKNGGVTTGNANWLVRIYFLYGRMILGYQIEITICEKKAWSNQRGKCIVTDDDKTSAKKTIALTRFGEPNLEIARRPTRLSCGSWTHLEKKNNRD